MDSRSKNNSTGISLEEKFANQTQRVIGRTRQTLWGECTDANLKTVAKRYMIEKK